jgi:hopene-associated glycosyltransferase HpnB
MDRILAAIAALSLVVWLVLIFARGGFWRARERLPDVDTAIESWPAVVAVVPARNEAEVIGRTISSLVHQDYSGELALILVDDHSADGTALVAQDAAKEAGQADRLTVIGSRPLPAGWTGKLWALSEGLRHAAVAKPQAAFVWFTDADIEHDPQSLRRLVTKAEREDRDLVSLMVLLNCEGFWEKLLIPPFVFFFAMLYPFAWVNDPHRRMAAAAGGCVLLRRAALERAGGLAPIRDAIIDDCALARHIKKGGRSNGSAIWLGLTERLRSIRPYEGLAGLWSMVVRSAYTQLGRSPIMLVLTVLGMAVVYLAPPILVLMYPWHGSGVAAALAALAWILMSLAIWPTLQLYRQSLWLAPLLPVSALLYCGMTLHSGVAHYRGRGGAWKGRVQGSEARSGTAP